MRRWLLVTILVLVISYAFAFSQQELEKMKNDPLWIVGLGRSSSESKSDQLAIKGLDAAESITLKEGESQTITFEMDTYSGSLQAKRNSWSTQRWISLSATALLAGGGVFCNMQSNSNFDKYETADTSADAQSYKQKTEDFENYRNFCYYAASGTAVYTLYSWIKTAVYSKKL